MQMAYYTGVVCDWVVYAVVNGDFVSVASDLFSSSRDKALSDLRIQVDACHSSSSSFARGLDLSRSSPGMMDASVPARIHNMTLMAVHINWELVHHMWAE